MVTARIASGPLENKCKKTCEIRFYYYYIGRAHHNFTENSKLSVNIRHCTGDGCNETNVWSTDKDTWHNWIRANVTLNSTEPFQVENPCYYLQKVFALNAHNVLNVKILLTRVLICQIIAALSILTSFINVLLIFIS